MKRVHLSRGSILLTAGLILSNVTIGQANSTIRVVLNNYDSMQNFRYYDQRGINVFETPKDNVTFQGFKVRFGAGFTQQFQSLKHENKLAAGYQSTNKLFAIEHFSDSSVKELGLAQNLSLFNKSPKWRNSIKMSPP